MPALTGLRFFLALWVILHHLTGPGQELGATLSAVLPAPIFTLMRGGDQAVTTFFVLSGVVLARSFLERSWSPAGFAEDYRRPLGPVHPVFVLRLFGRCAF